MKKDKDEKIVKKYQKKPIRSKLIKKIESKDNSKIFGSTFTSNFNSVNKAANKLLYQKINNIKKPHKFNLSNKTEYSNLTNNTSISKNNISIENKTSRNDLIKQNHIKMSSTFYITKDDKNSRNRLPLSKLNLSLKDNLKGLEQNKKESKGTCLTSRNNINNKREINKKVLEDAKESKNLNKSKIINKDKIKNIINKESKKSNKEESRKNKFNREKTVAKLKTKEAEEKKVIRGKSLNSKNNNDKSEKKSYNNLYDKYVERFKERMEKLSLNNNYIIDQDNRNKNNKSMNKTHKKSLTNSITLRTLHKNKINNEINIISKQNIEALKRKNTKINFGKRKVGKSVGTKINNNKNKYQEKALKNKKEENKSQKNDKITVQRRTKSMAKLTIKTKKNNNDDNKYDIEYIMYEKIKPSKNEDPFDDIDSIVTAIDFDKVRLVSKNIFSVTENEKYDNFAKKYDIAFNNFIGKNTERKSIEDDKKDENKSNNLQNEKTTDSFKKNKINVSFIENQNN